jgi:ribonuclease D
MAHAAERLSMPVENVATPEVIRRICWSPPQPVSAEAVASALRAHGCRDWQIDAVCDGLCQALLTTRAPEVTGE